MEAAVARQQPRAAGSGARELHRRIHGLGARARKEHRVESVGQTCRKLLGQDPGQHRIVDLHAIDQIRRERGLQCGAHVGMVMAEAREALAGVKIEIRAARPVVEVGPPRRAVRLVEAEDPQHVDERRIEVARGQVERLVGASSSVGDDAQRVENRTGL